MWSEESSAYTSETETKACKCVPSMTPRLTSVEGNFPSRGNCRMSAEFQRQFCPKTISPLASLVFCSPFWQSAENRRWNFNRNEKRVASEERFSWSILGDSLQSGLAYEKIWVCCWNFSVKASRNKLSKWFKSPAIPRPKRNTQKREKSFKTYFYREEKEKRRMSHKNCFLFGADNISLSRQQQSRLKIHSFNAIFVWVLLTCSPSVMSAKINSENASARTDSAALWLFAYLFAWTFCWISL